jgi:hypothetical protein
MASLPNFANYLQPPRVPEGVKQLGAGATVGALAGGAAGALGAPVAIPAAALAGGVYSVGKQALDPNAPFGQTLRGVGRAISNEPSIGGKIGAAVGGAPWVMGEGVKAAVLPAFKAFTNVAGGAQRAFAGSAPAPVANPISFDARANAFSRAPTNMAEYQQMQAARPAAPRPSDDQIRAAYQRQGIAVPTPQVAGQPVAQPAPQQAPTFGAALQAGGGAPQSATDKYNSWLMQQPLKGLNATDYANRAQLEIDQRAPDLAKTNFYNYTNWALAHPEHIDSQSATRHSDGRGGYTSSNSVNYGDRGREAANALTALQVNENNSRYRDMIGQAALERAGATPGIDKEAARVSQIDAARQAVEAAMAPDPQAEAGMTEPQMFQRRKLAAQLRLNRLNSLYAAFGQKSPYATIDDFFGQSQ